MSAAKEPSASRASPDANQDRSNTDQNNTEAAGLRTKTVPDLLATKGVTKDVEAAPGAPTTKAISGATEPVPGAPIAKRANDTEVWFPESSFTDMNSVPPLAAASQAAVSPCGTGPENEQKAVEGAPMSKAVARAATSLVTTGPENEQRAGLGDKRHTYEGKAAVDTEHSTLKQPRTMSPSSSKAREEPEVKVVRRWAKRTT